MMELKDLAKQFEGKKPQEEQPVELIKQDLKEAQHEEKVSNNDKETSIKEETLEKEHIVELDKILDEVIEEVKKQEETDIKCPLLDIPEEVVKEYEQMENQMPEQATNNEILKEAVINRGKIIDVKSDLHYLRSKETEHFIEVMKELHFIKKHMGKFAITTIGIVFLCGYVLGTQHEVLSPYIGKIWDLMNIFKGNGGQG